MGKGDKKTKKGKIASGSFGTSRKKRAVKVLEPAEAAPKKKPSKK